MGGEDRHEVSVCGVDPATRGLRMNECLTVVRQLLTESLVLDPLIANIQASWVKLGQDGARQLLAAGQAAGGQSRHSTVSRS